MTLKLRQLLSLSLPAVVEIELTGMPFSAPTARNLLAEKTVVRDKAAAKLADLAKDTGFNPKPRKVDGKTIRQFNPASTHNILECLKLLGFQVTDTKDETMKELINQGCYFAKDLLDYRTVAKQVNFLEEWLHKQHPADDRLHASYRQLNHNATGRFSCSDPNLQQVPSRGSDGATFRKLFVVPAGKKLIKADLAGIELRIMAWLSQDQVMIDAFMKESDLHRLTAAAMAGKEPVEVTKAERTAAKAVNFGLIYGCGAKRLMESAKYEYGVDMTETEAESSREAFFKTYPGIGIWHAKQKKLRFHPIPHYFHRYGRGYFKFDLVAVRTASRRKRIWPNYGGKTRATVTRLYNSPDQGSGADLLKTAMSDFYLRLTRNAWPGTRLVATVHDELVVEAPAELAEEVATELVMAMEKAGSELVQLKLNIET